MVLFPLPMIQEINMEPLSKDEQKQLFKEAAKEGLQEWLDKKYQELGKWTMRGICAMVLGTFAYIWLGVHGWHQ